MRADDVHFWVFVGDIDDAVIIIVVIDFEEGNKNGVLATFFVAVFVEFFKKVFVLVFGGGGVGFVFHFEHDGNEFGAVITGLAVDEVALATSSRVIVFFEIGFRESGRADEVELSLTMLFETFADHFGGLASFKIFIIFDLLVF